MEDKNTKEIENNKKIREGGGVTTRRATIMITGGEEETECFATLKVLTQCPLVLLVKV